MTQKELDQAANKYDESLTYSPISEQCDVKKAFVAGCAFTSLPVWLQIIGCVAGAIYLAYTFSKE
jgi:hypothetical protein